MDIITVLKLKDNFTKPLKKITSATDGYIDSTKRATKGIGNFKKNAISGFKKVGKKALTLGATFSTALAGGLIASVKGTKDFRKELSTLSTNAKIAGQDMGALNSSMETLYAITGDTGAATEGLSDLMATGFKDEGLTKLLDNLYGASIKFKDTLKFEGIADGLQETLATGKAVGGFGELLERSGIELESFDKGLQSAIKNGKEQNYVLETLSGTGLSNVYKEYQKNNKEQIEAEKASYRFNKAIADLGKKIQPLLTPVIEGLSNLINKILETRNIDTKAISEKIGKAMRKITDFVLKTLKAFDGFVKFVKKNKEVIIDIGIAMGTVFAIGKVMTFITAISSMINPWALLVTGIITGVAIIIRHWDEIKAYLVTFLESIGNFFSTVFESVKNFIMSVVDSFKQMFSNLLESIKGFSPGLFESISLIANNFKQIFSGITDFLSGVFTGNWKKAFEGLKNVVTGIFGALGNTLLLPIKAFVKGVNWAIEKINGLAVDIPDWVPIAGGKTLGFSIPKIPDIPKFKKGTFSAPSGLSLVNEEGGEIRKTTAGETIIPADKSGKLIDNIKNNKPSINVHVTIQGNIIGNREYAHYIGETIANEILTANKNTI